MAEGSSSEAPRSRRAPAKRPAAAGPMAGGARPKCWRPSRPAVRWLPHRSPPEILLPIDEAASPRSAKANCDKRAGQGGVGFSRAGWVCVYCNRDVWPGQIGGGAAGDWFVKRAVPDCRRGAGGKGDSPMRGGHSFGTVPKARCAQEKPGGRRRYSGGACCGGGGPGRRDIAAPRRCIRAGRPDSRWRWFRSAPTAAGWPRECGGAGNDRILHAAHDVAAGDVFGVGAVHFFVDLLFEPGQLDAGLRDVELGAADVALIAVE